MIGQLAKEHMGLRLPCGVLICGNGYYIGTADDSGPVSRESIETYNTEAEAYYALTNNTFTQKMDL